MRSRKAGKSEPQISVIEKLSARFAEKKCWPNNRKVEKLTSNTEKGGHVTGGRNQLQASR
jgi:hypothetical protein